MSSDLDQPIRLLISQRILTRYREDLFFELSRLRDIDVFVAFGDRKPGSYPKYTSVQDTLRIEHKRLWTLALIFERFGHVNQFFFSPGVLWQLVRRRPDVILTEGTSNILNNFLICTYALLTRTPYIWWDLGKIRGQESENIFRRMLYPIISFFYRRAAVILGYSGFARRFFEAQGIDPKRIVVAGNTVRLDRHVQYQASHPQAGIELAKTLGFKDKFVFLVVGALDREKRFDMAITAFLQLKENNDEIALVIVGNGPERETLLALADNHPDIHFAGARYDDVGAYFMLGDLFLLPGLGGLAINEAMVYGLPVVAAPADGTELDLVKDKETGFLIGYEALNELKEKMHWALNNRSQLEQMGQKAREFVTNHYSQATMIERIHEAILLTRKKTG